MMLRKYIKVTLYIQLEQADPGHRAHVCPFSFLDSVSSSSVILSVHTALAASKVSESSGGSISVAARSSPNQRTDNSEFSQRTAQPIVVPNALDSLAIEVPCFPSSVTRPVLHTRLVDTL